MRIAVDASRAARPIRTGTESYSANILRALVPIASPDRLTLYYDRDPLERLTGADSRIVPFPRLWTHARLSFEMMRSRPDALFVPAHVVPLVHPPATVVTIHDLGYLRFRTAYRPSVWIYLFLSTRWSARAARRVIADSDATKRDLLEHVEIDRSKVTVVHLGVEGRFRPTPSADSNYLLFVGTRQPRKNLRRLLRAYAAARQTTPMPPLLIAGAAGHRAAELGGGDGVHFLGYVPDERMPALYSGARAFVFPTLYEGFGLPLLEAMACGTPVIAGANSSMPEIVGDAGLLVDSRSEAAIAEALVSLVRDDDLHADLRQRGLERARQFTWERTARRTLEVIRSAAG